MESEAFGRPGLVEISTAWCQDGCITESGGILVIQDNLCAGSGAAHIHHIAPPVVRCGRGPDSGIARPDIRGIGVNTGIGPAINTELRGQPGAGGIVIASVNGSIVSHIDIQQSYIDRIKNQAVGLQVVEELAGVGINHGNRDIVCRPGGLLDDQQMIGHGVVSEASLVGHAGGAS